MSASPVEETSTGSTTRWGSRPAPASSATRSTVAGWASMPVLTATDVEVARARRRTWATTMSGSTLLDRRHPDGVLGRDGGDRRGAVHCEGGEGAQVGLDAGAAARVRPGDGERGDRFHPSTLMRLRRALVRWRSWVISFRWARSARRRAWSWAPAASARWTVLEASLVASESTIATVALRRVDPSVEGSIYDLLTRLKFSLLPNTAGCYSAAEAVKTAELAREAFDDDRGQARGDRRRRDAAARHRRDARRGRRSSCARASRSGPTPRTT